MIDALIRFSIDRRWLVLFFVSAATALGVWNYQHLPIDAVPDITNVQVQINTTALGFTPQETEQRITFPVETTLAGMPHLQYTRSLSRYGLSQVTAVFDDGTDLFFARQMVSERLQEAKGVVPNGIEPEMGPVSTGLGEIFLYTVHAEKNARQADGTPYDTMALRTLQDWVIRPQLRQVPGVAEVNSTGGFAKQFHVTPYPEKLLGFGLAFDDVVNALTHNNSNVGAGYIERGGEQLLVRVPGQAGTVHDIENIVVTSHDGHLIRVHDVADVGIGRELRTGAATRDGEETVLGTAIMLIGENSRTVSLRVAAKLQEINKTLPAGVYAEPVYDRTNLVNKTIRTVQKNLLEGAILVATVLLMLLGHMRAALLTALVIPITMLILITGMVESKVSANLMSLGALDFGLIVDGAVIIVENCLMRLAQRQHHLGRVLHTEERFHTVFSASREVFKPSLVSVIVVALVNLPIFALTGVEGKMFHPMAFSVVTALFGALILSVTFVPASCALLLTGRVEEKDNWLVATIKRHYEPLLLKVVRWRNVVIASSVVIVVIAGYGAMRLGAEFIPSLDEGDVALQAVRIPSTSLTQSVAMQQQLERAIVSKLSEVQTAFARIGTAEVATDPDSQSMADGYVMLKPKEQWPDHNKSKEQFLEELKAVIAKVPGNNYEISQPIERRFNELISGVRSDLGVKIYGDDLDELRVQGNHIAQVLQKIRGADEVKVEQTAGLPMLVISPKRDALARAGLSIETIQQLAMTAIGGQTAGHIFEGDRPFDVVVRLPEKLRGDLRALQRLPVPLPDDKGYVPLNEVADVVEEQGPNQISRENGKRCLVVSANIRDRDLSGFVAEARTAIEQQVKLPAGYWLSYGGTFEQLESATQRLGLLVPVTLVLIFALLLMTFDSMKDAALVFSGVPLALAGGVAALTLRGIPLSITAGVGFITLSGVAVLTGVVMISAFRDLLQQGRSIDQAIIEGSLMRLRPVVMIGLVASLGFLPMALNTGTGAEVQRPLATVVIGGIVSATLLSLVILPALYAAVYRKSDESD
ncbi:MAG TPA: CusA/CzcA family heavy metal efflux RND transporter [Pseudomonadales bacterium]|nr:CusA/CzcA family heavy metal efflux RND transporter [Pseudomonadales bacterium]